MSLSDFKKASFSYRLMTVLALTILFVFTALVLLENREIQKLLPHSNMRSFAILFGYCVAILSTNYFMALRGRNFIEWKIELLIAFNYVLLFSALTIPFLFPILPDPQPWWKLGKPPDAEPNAAFYGLLAFQPPLLVLTAIKIRRVLKDE